MYLHKEMNTFMSANPLSHAFGRAPAPGPAPDYIDKVAWALIRDRKVVYGLNHDETLAFNLGGKRQRLATGEWESDLETLVREAGEETGVVIYPETIRRLFALEMHTMDGRKLKEAYYFAECDREPKPRREVKELIELTSADIGQGKTTPMGEEALRKLAALDLID